MNNPFIRFGSCLAFGVSCACTTHAAQIDIAVPANSGRFGQSVAVLPNGNIVVADPNAGPVLLAGAVYLYSPDGVLISTITGSHAVDQVGIGGITVLANGNFVISSPLWANGDALMAGAVTWGDARSGVSGVVSTANSLVGTSAHDGVGEVTALPNGNYVVASSYWSNGAIFNVGAVTWATGTGPTRVPVSTANSLVGTHREDFVGLDYFHHNSVVPLSNGYYVVTSPAWNNGDIRRAGAATRCSANAPFSASVSATNSIVGEATDDQVGSDGAIALPGGNYIVVSTTWDNGDQHDAGAVTWVPASGALAGSVSSRNSLVGTYAYDIVGFGGVTILSNGNYVVASPRQRIGDHYAAGAATWSSGTHGIAGTISAANSLIGIKSDQVGYSITALSNGNYVVVSPYSTNGSSNVYGAATFGRGDRGVTGTISAANSLVGSSSDDAVGSDGVTALSNGNYVVASSKWSNGGTRLVGAVTWANGTTGNTGIVTTDNSIVGVAENDRVGANGVTALTNGHYVIASPYWSNGALSEVGAVTWASGTQKQSGVVAADNSLIGAQANDHAGGGGLFTSPNVQFPAVTALANGNYVVVSLNWMNGSVENAGALTWAQGFAPTHSVVSTDNSLVGTELDEYVGVKYELRALSGVTALPDGHFFVESIASNVGAYSGGAVTLARDTGPLTGTIDTRNSVVGTAQNMGPTMMIAYDPGHQQLVVGQPESNRVTLFRLDEFVTQPPRAHSTHRTR